MQEITVTLASQLKEKPADESKLGFGQIFTDHILPYPCQILCHQTAGKRYLRDADR